MQLRRGPDGIQTSGSQSQCFAPDAAEALEAAIKAEFPNANFVLEHTTALCSFYAEAGGLIVGFEGAHNDENDNGKYYN